MVVESIFCSALAYLAIRNCVLLTMYEIWSLEVLGKIVEQKPKQLLNNSFRGKKH